LRSLFHRSLDLLRLKSRYRYLIGAFLNIGLATGFLLVASTGYEAQIARGLTPGAPLGSEPGSIQFFTLFLTKMFACGFFGMALGGIVLCLLLSVLSTMSFRDAVRAIFLSYYPKHWFLEDSAL
jgi:hypothetical protein